MQLLMTEVQLISVYPGEHTQMYEFVPVTQVPSFWQVEGVQLLSMIVLQLLSVYPAGQTQI